MSLDVSVVVVTYNQAEKLRRALDSVIEQTRPPDQIVVTDDASPENTEAVIREYAETHSHLIDVQLNEYNSGIAANINNGLEAIGGDLFTSLAGDDWFLPQKLEREIECYRESDAQVVFSGVLEVN
jgi:glycosyltransferase involved in cell wall biosynthesis